MPPTPIQVLFQQAMTLHRSGRLAEAETAYRQITRVDVRDFPSRLMLGRLYLDQGRAGDAEKALEAAVKLQPRDGDALASYGLALLRARKFRPAATILARATEAEPAQWATHRNLGDALRAMGEQEAAVAAYDAALALEPGSGATWGARAAALTGLERTEDALADCDRALTLAPHDALALATRAEALAALDRKTEALEAFNQAITVAPDDELLRGDRARLLLEAGRPAEAAADCTEGLQRQPRSADLLRLRSTALSRLHRFDAALADCDAAIALAPREASGHFARGLRLEDLGRTDEAIRSYDRVLALTGRGHPEHLQALNNRCVALVGLQRYGEAVDGLRQILAVEPQHTYALGGYAHVQRLICDWSDAEAIEAALREAVLRDSAEIPPGTLLAYFDDAQLQLAGARNYATRNMPLAAPRPAPAQAHDRLRIAYLSADFHSHATMQLAIELFERHDRSRFEVCAISFGPDDNSAMRRRTIAAFESFHDVTAHSDAEIAALMREREIDIAVDLKGFTTGARPQVFAQRAAPLQVNYLGFPGTLGSEAYDYILADGMVAPLAMQPAFSEQIVQLPHSYQPNDARRVVPTPAPSRAEAGLPEQGLVFCSFNNTYKITPAVFDVWMRLLGAIDGAVLWLLNDNALAAANLRKQAAARGVDPARLVFAPRVPLEAHLARHGLADLFLDTLPYSAHTTASDALWMGLPLLTCLGGAFAGRVGASLCHAVGLDDLIAPDLGAYEQMALALANDPARRAAIRAHLEGGRHRLPLFDADLYRRGVEAAFQTMWARHISGQPPVGFAVDGL